MAAILCVFLGGGLGSLCRYGIARLIYQPGSYGFPWATVVANVLACIALGWLFGWAERQGMAKEVQLFLMTGFCGGFSTFSTFSHENWVLFENGAYGYLLINILVSVMICIGCIFLGIRLAGG